jgi:hypothetical protein
MVSVMTQSRLIRANERIIESMIALAGCSKLQRIIVAGSRSVELMFELHRCGYVRASGTANCGHAAGQYDVALVDWRQRTFTTLERTLDWLVDFLSPTGVLVVWVDSQKPAANQDLRSTLERRGFVVEAVTVREDGSAFSARRYQRNPISEAA